MLPPSEIKNMQQRLRGKVPGDLDAHEVPGSEGVVDRVFPVPGGLNAYGIKVQGRRRPLVCCASVIEPLDSTSDSTVWKNYIS